VGVEKATQSKTQGWETRSAKRGTRMHGWKTREDTSTSRLQ